MYIHTYILCACETFTKRDHLVGHKKVLRNEITQNILFTTGLI